MLRRIAEWFVNDKLRSTRIWKEAVVIYFKVLSQVELRKTTKHQLG